MDNKMIGFEIAPLKEGEKMVSVKVPGMKKYLKKEFGKNAHDYLREFLITKKNYDNCSKVFQECQKESLPKNLKDNCPKCGINGNQEEEFGSCARYHMQMNMTFLISATEYANIVIRNKFLYDNKEVLLKLTYNFYECFVFIMGEGKVAFDLDKLCRFCLNAGFISIADIFSKSETLNNLKIINNTLDDLDQKELSHKVLKTDDNDYIQLQKEFFEKKQKYYKEKLVIEEKENSLKPKTKKSVKKEKTISIVVLYFYYLQTAGDFPYFENHPEGKLKAIEELIEKEELDTTAKYFQIQYNKINNYQSNRIAKNQVANIDFVLNQMLSDYPKAKEIAISELKLAQAKNR